MRMRSTKILLIKFENKKLVAGPFPAIWWISYSKEKLSITKHP